MKFNKKASDNDPFNILNFILRIIFLSVLIVTFYLFYSTQFTYSLETENTITKIFEKRFIYSDTLFAYKDGVTKRVYPGIIDITKFNEEHITETFIFDKNYVAAKFTLILPQNDETKEIYFNKKWFDRWYPYSAFENYDKILLRRFVLVENDGLFESGELEIVIVTNNPSTEKTEVAK